MAGFELFGPTHQLLTTSLRVRATRHSLLSANIANVDTPGYRPRDIDFAKILNGQGHTSPAPYRSGEPVTLISTNPQHHHDEQFISERTPEGEGLDRNGVELEGEVTRMVENSLRHETSLTLLSRTLGGLRYAISEGRR
jgi:flagellar basal-body rod protein FlgB